MTARLVLAVTTAVGLAIAMIATTGPPPRYSPVVLRVDDRRLRPRNAPQVIYYRLEFVGDGPIPGGYAGGGADNLGIAPLAAKRDSTVILIVPKR